MRKIEERHPYGVEEREFREGPDRARLRRLVADSFQGFAGGDGHPCLGARSVVHRGTYDVGIYDRLGGRSAARVLAGDLVRFGTGIGDALASYVAVFTEPSMLGEGEFRHLLWRQLQLLHDCDSTEHAWAPSVSADPESAHFSYSVGGRAFFVVGLHAASPRWARRFAWPTLVFNPHEQFVALKETGRYSRMQSLIRGRDRDLQGHVNPALDDHGRSSEARQYDGSAVDEGWRCPLEVRS